MRPLPAPPRPFDAAAVTLTPGELLYRVHSNRRDPREPNPGFGPPTRFAFFTRGSAARAARVPVMYAATTPRAAIAETILHDAVRIPGRLSTIGPIAYLGHTLSSVKVVRELRLADLTGLAAKRLGVDGTALSAHDDYAQTVRWAEAAFRTGFDGLCYMSHRCNTDRAFVLFDRPVTEKGATRIAPLRTAFELASADPLDPVLLPSPGFDALVDACTAAGFEVLV